MRILILSQWFDPEPTFKGMAFAKELVRRGHEVEVLTGFPNYPGGKLYPGYRLRLWQNEILAGIRVLRVPLYPSHDHSSIGRAANYLSFALSASIGGMFIKRPDVVYVYHPPATIGLPALALKALRGVPVVYDIEDLWPDTLTATGMLNNRTVLGLIGRWCRFIYRRADRLVVLSPGFKASLIERGVPASKIHVIYNWCDEANLRSATPAQLHPASNGEFKVVFAGTMGYAQGLDAVLDAAQICMNLIPQARFTLIGGGVERQRLEQRAAQLPNVSFLPRQPMEAIGSFLSAADALLVHLKDDPLFRVTIPSKTQAYMAAGKPIIMGVRGDAAELVSRSGAGTLCEPENPASIAEAVCRLASLSSQQRSEMGRAGLAFYEREMSLIAGVAQFEQVFEMALN